MPHWCQEGVAHAVTLWTADSLPRRMTGRWLAWRVSVLCRFHIDPDAPDWRRQLREVAPQAEALFHRRQVRAFMSCLDRGHGACPMARPEVAAIVAEALRHLAGVKYGLGDFVVMPNHVHALLVPLGGWTLSQILRDLKRFTARRINELLGRTGQFWQHDGYNRIVRTPHRLAEIERYIADNPKKLRPGTFLLSSGCGSTPPSSA